MPIPCFEPFDDPGPSFVELLRRNVGDVSHHELLARVNGNHRVEPFLRAAVHGTTILAVRYEDGVVMAADRRAVVGSRIILRTAEKLFALDARSGIAVSGLAGPALQLVRLLQTEFEHYEKVQGMPLTADGKVNRIARLLRDHLPAALLGMGVVPLFAGHDERRRAARLFSYDLTGGRYEEADFSCAGSGSGPATAAVKFGFTDHLDRSAATDLALTALYCAADEDSFTGGPDLVRRIYPTVATIDAAGFRLVNGAEVAERCAALHGVAAGPGRR